MLISVPLLFGDVKDAKEYQKELQQKFQQMKENFKFLKNYYRADKFKGQPTFGFGRSLDMYKAVRAPMERGITLVDTKLNEFSYIPAFLIDTLFTLSQDMREKTTKEPHITLFSIPTKEEVINVYQDRFALLEILLATVSFATIANVLNQYEQLKTKNPQMLQQVLVDQFSWLTQFIKQSEFASMLYPSAQKPKEKLLQQIFSDLYSNFADSLKQAKDLPKKEVLVNLLLPKIK